MSTTDEILANPLTGLDLPAGAIPVRVVVLVEFMEPGSDHDPQRTRLAYNADDSCSAWTTMGMLRFAEQLEFHAVRDRAPGD